MSASFGDSGAYPGRDYSLSQLLQAAKRRLADATFGGRYVKVAVVAFDFLKHCFYRTAMITSQAEVSQRQSWLSIRIQQLTRVVFRWTLLNVTRRRCSL